MITTLVGDIHGDWRMLRLLSKKYKDNQVIFLGDFGVGFPPDPKDPDPAPIPNVKFVRGNHDNPAVCKLRTDYLGDYGVMGKIGFISGAWSIDHYLRTPDVDWWEDEQLSSVELQKAIDLIVKEKPPIIISHCAPDVFAKELVFDFVPTRTGQAMQILFEQYQPELWVCGHYHTSLDLVIGRTMFKCLNIAEPFDLNEDEY